MVEFCPGIEVWRMVRILWEKDRSSLSSGWYSSLGVGRNDHSFGLSCYRTTTLWIRAEDQAEDQLLIIGPNPIVNTLEITSRKKIQSFSIADITGKSIMQKTVQQANNLRIDSQAFPVGSYFIELTFIDRTQKVEKFIKLRVH